MIEEIDDLKPDVVATAYQHASEWLSNCYSQELLLRFKAAGIKLAKELGRGLNIKDPTELLFHKPIRLPDEVLKYERDLISDALAKANKSPTHAAKLLGVRYQTLASISKQDTPSYLKNGLRSIVVHAKPNPLPRAVLTVSKYELLCPSESYS